MRFTGCKNWRVGKCIRCGAYLGMSSCFEPIKFKTKEEADKYYQKKGGRGASPYN